MNTTLKAPNDNWWRGGVIYQIYPRSFADSNADGIGDLPGITQRLDYIAQLGVDSIWLSPFFKSPMKDFGYDVSDYCDVDPMFGTLADLKALVARAHELKLKVMIDLVLSHTSEQHPWFVESRANADNPKADWYVWADAQPDGTPPNNWLSIFGGSAWQWDTHRCQYYLHNFLTSQPDLNFHHPEVQNALLAALKFWLDLGVDGYRLDTVNFYVHDAQLRNNPPKGKPEFEDPAVPSVNPYSWQWHKYDKSQPENLVFLRRMRALLDQYPNTTMVGEIGDDNGLARMAEYTSDGDKLHMAYCFDLLGDEHSAPFIRTFLQRFIDEVGSGWPCWALTNHDRPRVATRWGGATPSPDLLRLAAALQLSLRGSPCVYQGDELGLPEAEIDFADLQDPYGITMWPEYKGRDGCRTPMPWRSSAPDMGFGDATHAPWLPLAETHRPLAVDRQENDPNSLLSFYRHFLAWRKTQPALLYGEFSLLAEHPQLLAYVRTHGAEKILCLFNLSEQALSWSLPSDLQPHSILSESGLRGASLRDSQAQLPPYAGLFVRLQ